MNNSRIAQMIDNLGGPGYLIGNGLIASDAIGITQAYQIKRVADALEHIAAAMVRVEDSGPAVPEPSPEDVDDLVNEKIKGHRLCYVDGRRAYFTNKEIILQTGDDWNDVPYEHNAGPPYCREPGQIVFVDYMAGDTALNLPGHQVANSPFSVDEINRNGIAWLEFDYPGGGGLGIAPGAPPQEFADFIRKAGGTIGGWKMMAHRP